MNSYKIIITNEANIDIRESVIWYNKQKSGLGKRFYNLIVKSVELIKKNPLAFEIRYDDIRVYTLTKFPYLIHYLVYDDYIYIINILHSSRDTKV